jgi:hypothetical protein
VSEEQPLLRIVRGEPSEEELATLVAVVARSVEGAAEPERPQSGWVDRLALAGRTPIVGAGAWTASGRAPGARTRAGW